MAVPPITHNSSTETAASYAFDDESAGVVSEVYPNCRIVPDVRLLSSAIDINISKLSSILFADQKRFFDDSPSFSSPSTSYPYQKFQVLASAWLEEDTPFFDYGGVGVGEAPRDPFFIGKRRKHAVLGGVRPLSVRYSQS